MSKWTNLGLPFKGCVAYYRVCEYEDDPNGNQVRRKEVNIISDAIKQYVPQVIRDASGISCESDSVTVDKESIKLTIDIPLKNIEYFI